MAEDSEEYQKMQDASLELLNSEERRLSTVKEITNELKEQGELGASSSQSWNSVFKDLSKMAETAVTNWDKVNKVMGLYFRSGKSEIWGLQYHPDYEYWQMLNLSNGRKDRILQNNHFDNENDFQNHLNYIKEEDKKLDFENRTFEIRNWLNYLKN